MTIDKPYLEQKLRSLQEQAQTLQANLEALGGAMQMTRIILADLERPAEPVKAPGPQLVKPISSTTDLVPAVEGEP